MVLAFSNVLRRSAHFFKCHVQSVGVIVPQSMLPPGTKIKWWYVNYSKNRQHKWNTYSTSKYEYVLSSCTSQKHSFGDWNFLGYRTLLQKIKRHHQISKVTVNPEIQSMGVLCSSIETMVRTFQRNFQAVINYVRVIQYLIWVDYIFKPDIYLQSNANIILLYFQFLTPTDEVLMPILYLIKNSCTSPLTFYERNAFTLRYIVS